MMVAIPALRAMSRPFSTPIMSAALLLKVADTVRLVPSLNWPVATISCDAPTSTIVDGVESDSDSNVAAEEPPGEGATGDEVPPPHEARTTAAQTTMCLIMESDYLPFGRYIDITCTVVFKSTNW